MSFVKEIVRFLRKTDEVDTIRSDTKDFLEQNDASVILDLIDKNRSNDKGMISGVLSAKEVKTSYTVMKDGKSYVLRRVGSRNLSSI